MILMVALDIVGIKERQGGFPTTTPECPYMGGYILPLYQTAPIPFNLKAPCPFSKKNGLVKGRY